MFGSKNKTSSKGTKIDTLIGQNSEVQGDIVFSGGLHVDGTIKGNVFADADSGSVLSLSERGLIEGEVRVPNIVLNGNVRGDVHAAEHIELAEKARVTGNVFYKFIEMVRGSEVNGNLVHRDEGYQTVAKKADSAPAASPKQAEAVAEVKVNS